ncbi:MAG TPA: response regulator [Ktedonosporobacter sp.]|nr:response regulator [Ktedonosporobacter sp.]
MNTAQILLVDDDPVLLEALTQMIALRMSGVQIMTALSAQDALKLIEYQEYDVVVSDIKMPGMDGLGLMARIQEQCPEIPVLLITGHGEHDLAIRALRGGAYDYIQKPIDRDDFEASLHRALQTRQMRRQIEEQQWALERYALSLEQRFEQRTHELEAANVAKDRLMSIVARELIAPLANLRDMKQLTELPLRDGTERAGRLRQGLADMESALYRLQALVQSLEDVSSL